MPTTWTLQAEPYPYKHHVLRSARQRNPASWRYILQPTAQHCTCPYTCWGYQGRLQPPAGQRHSDRSRIKNYIYRQHQRGHDTNVAKRPVDKHEPHREQHPHEGTYSRRIRLAAMASNAALNLQAGTRYEYSRTQLIASKPENTVDRKIGKLFPTFFFNEKNKRPGRNFNLPTAVASAGHRTTISPHTLPMAILCL